MAMAREIMAKKRGRLFLWLFVVVVVLLALSIALYFFMHGKTVEPLPEEKPLASTDSVVIDPFAVCYKHSLAYKPLQLVRSHYSAVFNDENDIQLAAAKRNGIKELTARKPDYEKYGLVRLESNRYYTISELKYSVPYLVPEACVMLNTIGKCFQDVLAEKYPKSQYKIIVTSVLRTGEDVHKLVRRNRWATENSCHKHGTTVDISYQKFDKISGREIGAYEMKEVLAIALSELRDNKLCYVKYERRNCFHVTLNQINIDGLTVDSTSVRPKKMSQTTTPPSKPERVYKNKDAERLHRLDEAKKKEKTKKHSHYYDDRPSPML